MNNCGIYKITSPTGRVYIGQSINISKRIKYYKALSCSGQRKVYASLKKYGWDAHRFDILEFCESNLLNDREVYYIKLFNSFDSPMGMNLDSGGNVKKQSKETREKRSKSLKGRVFTQEWKDKIGEKSKGRMLGFKHSEETKKKLRDMPRKKWDKPHPRKGTGFSDEEKRVRHNLANRKWRAKKKKEKIKELK